MPRYGRVEDVIRLALELQGTTVGLSLDQIGEMFGVSRRTSERMLNAVRRVYPQLEGRILEDGKKYWRHRGSAARALVSWKPEELAALDTAAKLADRDGFLNQAISYKSPAHSSTGK